MDSVDLPTGKTCLDCNWFSRCDMLGVARLEQTECDWSPSRFVDRSERCRDGEGHISHDYLGEHCRKCGRKIGT